MRLDGRNRWRGNTLIFLAGSILLFVEINDPLRIVRALVVVGQPTVEKWFTLEKLILMLEKFVDVDWLIVKVALFYFDLVQIGALVLVFIGT